MESTYSQAELEIFILDKNDIDQTVAILLSVMQAEDRESRFLDFAVLAESDINRSLTIHLNRLHPECEDWESVLSVLIPLALKKCPQKQVTDRIASLIGKSRQQSELGLGQIQFQPIAAALSQHYAEEWRGFEEEAMLSSSVEPRDADRVFQPSTGGPSPIRLFESSVIAWKTNEPIDKQIELPERTIYEIKRDILRERLGKRVSFHFGFDLSVCDDLADKAIEHYEIVDRVREFIRYPLQFIWEWRLYEQAKKFKKRLAEELPKDLASAPSASEIDQDLVHTLNQILSSVDEMDRQVMIARFWDDFYDRLICQKLYHLGNPLDGAGAIAARRIRLYKKLKDLLTGEST